MEGFDLSTVSGIYMGGSEISALYLGDSLIYPTNYEEEYFTICSLASNNNIGFILHYDNYYGKSDETFTISYSRNKKTWSDFTITVPPNETLPSSISYVLATIGRGNKLYIKSNTSSFYKTNNNKRCWLTIYCYKNYKVQGNIMSLIYGDNYKDGTVLYNNSFKYLFSGSTTLIDAENLYMPASMLANNCYESMFSYCNNLLTPPELPATILADYCYEYMFRGCTSLTTAPVLPATILADYCYEYMFRDCKSLTTAPVLPATTLEYDSYYGMFSGCTSLTTAPVLPATTLDRWCYSEMFYNCTSLTTAPVLPATTLANYCYAAMFYNCTSLTAAPELPATTLATGCYYQMFQKCSSLMNAPVLPADTLVYNCYQQMFDGCTLINYIECLASNPSTSYTNSWVSGVSKTGVFVKRKNINWSIGTSGIPTDWTITEQRIYSEEYLTIESQADNNTISWKSNDASYTQDIQYSTDKTNWTTVTSTTSGSTLATLNRAEKIYLKGSLTGHASQFKYDNIVSSGNFKVYGNIMSLTNGDNFINATTLTNDYQLFSLFRESKVTDASNLILPATTLSNWCYADMFLHCTSLTTTPTLPATTLTDGCYSGMFRRCTSLTTTPTLPATTFAYACYMIMFEGCTSLTSAPVLPVTTLARGCYNSMFQNCTSLTTAPVLPATTLTDGCYGGMFQNCTSLTTAPVLPATTLARGCYEGMFLGCTSLTSAPVLPATTLARGCYNSMFWGCTSLTTAPALPAPTLVQECYMGMFSGCTSLTTAPALPAPTLAESCYYYMFKGCTSLNSITMLATNISASDCLTSWVDGVAATGTFYKAASMTTLPTGANGIPTGWTVHDVYIRYSITIGQTTNGSVTSNTQTAVYGDIITLTVTPDSGYELDTLTVLDANSNPITVTNNQFTMPGSNVTVSATFIINYNNQYLTIESQANNNAISWKSSNASYTQDIQYSIDKTNWTTVTSTTSGATLATLNNGDKLYLKGLLVGHNSGNYYEKFSSSGNFKVYGNIMSLTNGDNFASSTSLTQNYQLASLFRSSKVTDITNLIMPATTLKRYCYQNMFNGCTQLTTAATTLPATSVDYYSYASMFQGCTSLITPPILCGITLGGYAYSNMFSGCTSLTTLPRLADATTITSWAPYRYMFSGCTGITDARYDVNGDRLLPTHLTVSSGGSAYELMFQNCTNLQYAPELTDMNAHHGEFNQMFKGCTSLYSIITHASSLGTANFGAIVENTGHVGTVYKAKDVTWDTSQYSQFNYTSGSAWSVIDGNYNAGDYQT